MLWVKTTLKLGEGGVCLKYFVDDCGVIYINEIQHGIKSGTVSLTVKIQRTYPHLTMLWVKTTLKLGEGWCLSQIFCGRLSENLEKRAEVLAIYCTKFSLSSLM